MPTFDAILLNGITPSRIAFVRIPVGGSPRALMPWRCDARAAERRGDRGCTQHRILGVGQNLFVSIEKVFADRTAPTMRTRSGAR